MINVVLKTCLDKSCNIRPSFNLQNTKFGIYCDTHKKENMVNVLSKKCLEENCDKQSNYNLPNEKSGLYCAKHKKNGMIDVKHKTCKEEHCNQIPKNRNNKYKGYCLRCFINKFPNEKISINYKVKETHMTDFLKEILKDEIMTFDKQTGGCSKRRPDCYIDKFTHVVIECDENQHRDTSCENKRTMELFQDFGNRPVIYIRFNPDTYINKENKKILSSFKYHKGLDVPIIRDKNEWYNRLNILKECTDKHLLNIPVKEVTTEYLFYDKC